MSVQITELHKSVSDGNGFELYRHYSESQAAKFLGMHPVTLKKKRLAGEISYLRFGERSLKYFGYQIADHFLTNVICHDTQNENSNLEITGLASGETHPPTAVRGSIRPVGKRAEFLSAQRILRKPKSC